MKEPRLAKKKNKFLKGLFIYIVTFLIIWMALFLFLAEPATMTKAEQIFMMLPGVMIIIVGSSLFLFFRRQIVDIYEDKNKIIFILYSDKKIVTQKKDIVRIIETPNRYIFYLISGKNLSAYKYMPPFPLSHKKKIDKRVNEIFSDILSKGPYR